MLLQELKVRAPVSGARQRRSAGQGGTSGPAASSLPSAGQRRTAHL